MKVPYRWIAFAWAWAAALMPAQATLAQAPSEARPAGAVDQAGGMKPVPKSGPVTAAQPAAPRVCGPAGTVPLKAGEMPRIAFDTPTYEFGRVRAGTRIEHDFWFTNVGNGPLEILLVRPS